MSVEFFADYLVVKYLETGTNMWQGESRDGVYSLSLCHNHESTIKPQAAVAFTSWYQRMGHTNPRIVHRFLRDNQISF